MNIIKRGKTDRITFSFVSDRCTRSYDLVGHIFFESKEDKEDE